MFFNKSKSVVGLDIGSSSIKVVEMEPAGGSYRLKEYGVADLLPEAIVDGEIMDRQLVVETIQNLFESKKLRARRVVTAVSGRSVIVKKILMDRLAIEDAKEAIHWEAEQHVPYDINDVSLDFQILDAEIHPKQMQVLLVAAKRDMLNAHADLIRQAGLMPVIIDVDSFAVQNAVLANYDFTADEVVALINIGAEITNINIIQNNTPHFTQDLALGGNTFVEAIMKRDNVSQSEALAATRGEEAPSFDMKAVVESVCEELSTAIERSIIYLKTSGDSERITRILISGGGVRIPGVLDFLSRRHRVPVEIVDPLKRIQFDPALFDGYDPKVVGPSLTVGIGLALRKVEDR